MKLSLSVLISIVYNFAKFALNMGNGCLDQIGFCRATNLTTAVEQAICTEAENICRDTVEGVFYTYGERGAYDIRHPYGSLAHFHTLPSFFFMRFKNDIGIKLS